MRELLRAAKGVRLLGDDYYNHFNEHFWKTGRSGFWKLERLQHFEEPGDESWVAFSEGDWDRSLALLDERRSALRAHYAKISNAQFETWRIRIVESPLTDYMQWELHLLHLRDQLGGHTRILPAHEIAQFEQEGLLPELITLGDDVMYEILYDENGLQEGGVLYVDTSLVTRCRELIKSLYQKGEPISTYFARDVEPLGPPIRSR
ncbi:hypothetical protein BBK82_26135 [Lentzea guizhouensis]|uniref:DUF6879 domain-containing protein n=1 Tax=Lentzea guizhouensis TaxID=1586287 RepID=A0A1B2HMT2_9PSEU|nr:DUF6879 family protein [Lentzea guizhouensis]ANZ39033.1 hypothetical protein BBK82_26135 [Lentzea guizhouensis]